MSIVPTATMTGGDDSGEDVTTEHHNHHALFLHTYDNEVGGISLFFVFMLVSIITLSHFFSSTSSTIVVYPRPYQPRKMEILLSPFLATLSYLPFKVVAKITIIVCAFLFVIDPYPGSRLISIFAVCCVNLIHRVNTASSNNSNNSDNDDDK
jgi:hypothetical protein